MSLIMLSILAGPFRTLGLILVVLAASCPGKGPSAAEPGVVIPGSTCIDHTCTDLSAIPQQWVELARDDVRLHYAHTSHGSQLITGLELIGEDDTEFTAKVEHGSLPGPGGGLRVFDGQVHSDYVSPDMFWSTADGLDMTREVLDANPSINVCMWSWCCQMDDYGGDSVRNYLDAMGRLESEYPGVTFVYMTGNAQATGSAGYNRYLRNEQIRDHCRSGGRVLFDFADLDCWWHDPLNGEWDRSTYRYEGMDIPVEHSAFNGDQTGHTTYESCMQKGRALWWLLAVTTGWDGA